MKINEDLKTDGLYKVMLIIIHTLREQHEEEN